ncbi:hypothetical protein L0665_03595 [Methanogenium marinum]|uniref:Uncharacterized protein n=1 Tax=Methanogenium marinum TaxID=348610 RepID=A0A9Q4KSF1_9EURY|nr:hypothetical protein [Methanogenium marinum]MDE4907696.1 hypothetical protein [Methanogenium marinum]
MDMSIPIPAHPSDLARVIAALANSGGGCFIVDAEYEQGRKALTTALTDIMPQPVFSGTKIRDSPEEKRPLLINGIVCPAHLSVWEEEKGLIVTVTPGDAFCTLKGEVIVFEGENIRTLTIADVVRISGSGG